MKNFTKAFLLSALMFFCLSCKKLSTNSNAAQTDSQQLKTHDITEKLLGVNYNTTIAQLNTTELTKTKTVWVRGILPFFRYYNKYVANPTGGPSIWFADSDMVAYMTIKDNGYKSIANIKFDFTDMAFPVKNSTEFNKQMDFLEILLDHIMPKTSLVVVGNEPFIESQVGISPDQRDIPLNDYYQAAIARTHTYLLNNTLPEDRQPLYVGAFDNLYESAKRTSIGLNKLLTFAKATAYVDGVDVHIHHHGIMSGGIYTEIDSVLSFVNPKIRPAQEIIVTEFSLAKEWDDHTGDNLSSTFLALYPQPAGVTKVWQYINDCLKVGKQRTLAEWTSFNIQSPWLAAHKNYFCTAFNQFKSEPKFWIACYSMRQAAPIGSTFAATDKPWLLNGLFLNSTVKLEPDGDVQKRWGFFEDFLAIDDSDSGTNPCTN